MANSVTPIYKCIHSTIFIEYLLCAEIVLSTRSSIENKADSSSSRGVCDLVEIHTNQVR